MHPVNRWRARRKSLSLALPLAVLLAFLSAGPAFAHTRLDDTTPGDGQKLTVVPGAVSLTFSGEVLKLGAAVKVKGPDGTAAVGAAKLKGRTVSWPLTVDLTNGKYTVSWRVTSADGHPIDGKFGFVLAAPVEATGTPTPAVPTPVATPHTAEPQMTGPMDGMEGMPGMATQPPSAAGEAAATTGSSTTTAVAIAGLVLLTVMVAGAIVIERRRRPRPGAGPSGPSSD